MLVVGHLVVDTIIHPGWSGTYVGGVPTYASMTALRMGLDVQVCSRVGWDFPDEYAVWLARSGLRVDAVRRVEGSPTTRFLLDYRHKPRRLRLLSRCTDIQPEDLPHGGFDLALAGPVANEVPREVVSELRERVDLVAGTLQGFVRRFGRDGSVTVSRWMDTEVLGKLDVASASLDELLKSLGARGIWEALELLTSGGVEVAVATMGEEGAAILAGGRRIAVPAYRLRGETDPTGAGDSFLAAFLSEYVRGEDPKWCGAVASAAASFVAEGRGPSRFGSRGEVLERALEIYEGVRTA